MPVEAAELRPFPRFPGTHRRRKCAEADRSSGHRPRAQLPARLRDFPVSGQA